MKKQKIDKSFISDIDIFLNKFDQTHPEKSESQKKEIEKHERIFKLRDEPASEE